MSTPWNGADALAVIRGAGENPAGSPAAGAPAGTAADAGSGPGTAATELEGGITMLREVAAGTRPPTLRLYRPSPTVAFGQRDARLPGFGSAAEAAAAHGFTPLVRRAGGRAAAYHPGCLVVDHLEPATDGVAGTRSRFAAFGELFARVLAGLGVDAHVGEVPGEYCPGEFSVHGRRDGVPAVKLVGTAQRVVAGAWFFSSVVVVEDAAPIRAVLTDVYAALGLVWEPATAGAAKDLAPGVTVDDVERALLAAYAAVVRLDAPPASGVGPAG